MFRRLLVFLAFGAVALQAGCGEKKDLPVVGFYQHASGVALDEARTGYLRALSEGGFRDGETVRIVLKNAEGDLATGQLICQEFLRQRVDLIGTLNTAALEVAMKATSETPIVFGAVADPYVTGAGEAPDRHKPNVTGVYTPFPLDEVLEIAHRLLPRVRKFGYLYNPGDTYTDGLQKVIRKKAGELDLELVEVAATNTDEVLPGVQALHARGAKAIVQMPGVNIYAAIESLIREAKKARIPVFTPLPSQTEYGAVVAKGVDFGQAGYEAGQVAVSVLKGEKPAVIPFRKASRQQLWVNRKAAAELGIELPKDLIDSADKVIE